VGESSGRDQDNIDMTLCRKRREGYVWSAQSVDSSRIVKEFCDDYVHTPSPSLRKIIRETVRSTQWPVDSNQLAGIIEEDVMSKELRGKRVAILVADGFEQVELTEPRAALEDAGADTAIVSPEEDEVTGWKFTEWGDTFPVDLSLEDADPKDFDALLLPGGVMNPDSLRIVPEAIEFIKGFLRDGKPMASICHGPWTLIEAEAVRGRKVTSWPSLKTDLRNAGATWVDQEVVVDNGIVTSRKPDDIPAFNRKVIEEFAKGKHTGRHATA
jgi:deglycase